MTQSTTSSTRTFMTPPAEKKPPKKPRQPRKLLALKHLPHLIILALLIFSAFMFTQYREAKDRLKANDPAIASSQVSDVIAKVRKLAIVPTNETPTVVTVANFEKLKSQPFFANAKDGDKVLVYSKVKRAILYRPSSNQIVNISSVNVSPNGSTSLAP